MNPALPGEKPSAHTPLWKALIALAIFGITFLSVMAAVGVTCFFLPRQYYSRVRMEVKSDYARNVFSNENASRTFRDPNLQPTQFQVLQSKEILYPVIDNLKLVDSWSAQEGTPIPKEEVYRALVGSLELTPVRNTDLIEVGVFSKDRVEAANIANMIAVVYQKVLRDDQMQIRDAGLAQLKEEVLAQRKSVEAAQQEMQKIRDAEKVIDPNPDSLDSPQPTASQAYINTKLRYLNGKKILEAAESRLSTERLQMKMQPIPVKIWEKAEPSINPSTPTSAKIMTLMGLGVVAGLILGSLVAGLSLLYLFRRV